MVEVGKKYRKEDWPQFQWVVVLMIDGNEFWGKTQAGYRATCRISDPWIEVKQQRPKTLADCAKEGDFTPKMVTLGPCPDVFVRIASPGSNFAWDVNKDGSPLDRQAELEEYNLWPEVLIDDV